MNFSRLPRHIGVIPDGNRRWARARGLPVGEGYLAGVEPGVRLLERCQQLGIEEVSVYGFTKENVRRPKEQVQAFRDACVRFSQIALDLGAALLAVGDSESSVFPKDLQPYAAQRSKGDIRVNLLVNYSWTWDLAHALKKRNSNNSRISSRTVSKNLASSGVSPLDLVIRWGGRQRLSGFLPFQSAYADIFMIDTLWPDMEMDEFFQSLEWYQRQDVTRGG